MNAITRTAYGSPEVLKLKIIDQPIPKKDEILVRIHATTVNRTDCGILAGKPYLIRAFTGLWRPKHLVTGTDFAGKIEAVGEGVQNFKVGDRVWGLNDEGLQSHAQYMTIKADQAVAVFPDYLTYQEVVACAEGAHYAYNFINKMTFEAGDRILVNGATGAIGSAALQQLKYHGAIVTAVGNTKNMTLLRTLGADKTVNYEQEDFTKDTERYCYILDTVGKSNFAACKHLLRPRGVYMSSELGANAQNLYLPLTTKLSRDKRVVFPIPSNWKRSILFMNDLLKKRKFKPVIDRTYPMKRIQEAYEYVATGQKTGNVIIEF